MKSHAKVTPELRHWIVSQIELGRSPVELIKAMTDKGWPEGTALDIMERTLRTRVAQLKAKQNQEESASPAPADESLPDPIEVPQPLRGRPNTTFRVLDREVRVLARANHPPAILFGGLLSDEECDELVTLASGRMAPSEVVDMQTGGNKAHAGRTSSGMYFLRGETPLVERLERRIEALTAWPYDRGEGLQILHYAVGQEYQPHFDYVDPAQPGSAPFLARGGQRVATLIVYLNSPTAGGATGFPDVGLEFSAVKGSALFFSYDRAHPSTGSRHGGMPVTAGEKWIATKWLRQSTHS